MTAKRWHEDDRFWEGTAPFLFSKRRWESAPEEVEKMIALLEPEPGASLLDLACGPGRHSLELARRGFLVTGVDRTFSYLQDARHRAEAEGLEIEFIQQDMRGFRRRGAYDAAINIFTSFGFFDDPDEDKQVLQNLHASLKPGGKLLLDVMGKEVLARIFRERDWVKENGIILLEERKLLDGWSRVESRWMILRDSKREEFTLKLRLYAGSELASLLKEAGFGSVELYGSLDGAPYDHRARRLVALAAK